MNLFTYLTIKYWGVHSIGFTALGIASGCALSCATGAASPLPATILAGLAGFLLFQWQAIRIFFGARRGGYEYNLLMKGIDARVARLVRQRLGLRPYIRCRSIGLKEEHLSAVMKEKGLSWTDLICLLITASALARKNREKDKEIRLLHIALDIHPYSLIVNSILAECYESQGMIAEAMGCYCAGKRDQYIASPALKNFLNRKMEQVRRKRGV